MILISRIKQIVDGLLDYVMEDMLTHDNEEDTFLYHMFYGIKDGSFDFYEQAKKLFSRTDKSPRKIKTTLEYPKDKQSFPLIVIREPNKTPMSSEVIGGFGEVGEDLFEGVGSFSQREGFRSFTESIVNIMCFTDNTLESVLLGEVLYALLQGSRNTFEQEFVGFNFTLQELMAENSLFPLPLLIKNLEIKVQTCDNYASIIEAGAVSKFIFEVIPIKK